MKHQAMFQMIDNGATTLAYRIPLYFQSGLHIQPRERAEHITREVAVVPDASAIVDPTVESVAQNPYFSV